VSFSMLERSGGGIDPVPLRELGLMTTKPFLYVFNVDEEELANDELTADFQRGFIKAEIVSYDHLMEVGSMAEAKAKGWVRMEGKDYVMQDGDVVEFRFNVSFLGPRRSGRLRPVADYLRWRDARFSSARTT